MKKALLAFLFVTIYTFTFSYVFYPAELLPMPVGWDTARYIWQMEAIAKDFSFIVKSDFNNFIYAALGSLFVRLSVTAFVVEMLLPPLLLFSLFSEVCFLLRKLQPHKDWKIYAFTTLSWFGIYRISTDLHSNLLALNTLLLSVYLFFVYLRGRGKQYLCIVVALLALSSFIHVESTLFFILILVLSLYAENGFGKMQKIAVTSLFSVASLPSLMLYYLHIKKLLVYSGGSFEGSFMSFWQWLIYLGPVGFIGIYQLFDEVRLGIKGDFLKRFFVIWGFVSIALGLTQYLESSFMIFSERAVILFPAPFLAIRAIGKFDCRFNPKKNFIRMKMKISLPILLALVNIFIISFASYSYISIAPKTYKKMLLLKQRFENKTILLIVDYSDRFAGEIGLHINDWGKATIKNFYTYIGNIYYLRDFMPTPYFWWSSRQASNLLFQEILYNINSLDDVEIIYGLDFTDFPVLPEDFEKFMEPLEDNLYIVNVTRLQETSGKFVIPVFQHSKVVHGTWYLSNKSWTDNQFVFECWMTGNIAQYPTIEVLFAVSKNSTYTVDLEYWANKTTSLQIQFEGQTLTFDGTEEPQTVAIYDGFLSVGEHILKVTLVPKSTDQGIYLRALLNVLKVSQVS